MINRFGLLVTALVIQLSAGHITDAQTADQSYQFAQELWESGDDAFALLEFKRFAFHHPQHEYAPPALLRVGLLYAGYAENLERANDTFARIIRDYPKTESATRAEQLQAFIEANREYGGAPLVRFMRAQMLASRGDPARASQAFLEVAEKWPEAKLSDRALLEGAKLQSHNLDKAQQAINNLNRLLTRYPDSPLTAEARFELALATEKLYQSDERAGAYYKDVIEKHPGTSFARRAQERLADLAKQSGRITRQYDRALVQKYKTVKSGQSSADRYTLIIELPSTASEREVSATLEDALIRAVGERKNENDAVRVEAYFNYPFTEAGEATWKPGTEPRYELEERDTEDVLKDTLFDILRNRE